MKRSLAVNRRTFFKQASLFGGLSFLLALGRPALVEAKPTAGSPEPASQGYRLTEQIKQYYAAARK